MAQYGGQRHPNDSRADGLARAQLRREFDAAIVLTYMRSFQLGHRVKIADTVEDVIEKSFFILNIKNEEVMVPSLQALNGSLQLQCQGE